MGCSAHRIATFAEDAVKKVDQEGVTKLEARLRRDSSYVGNATLDRSEQAKVLMQSKAASGSSSAFSQDARAVAALGKVREAFESDLKKYEEDEDEDEKEAGEKKEVGADSGSPPGKGKDGKDGKDGAKVPASTFASESRDPHQSLDSK